MYKDRIQARCAAGLLGLEVGTYSNPVLSTDAGETFRALWAKCTGAGHVYGQRLNIQATSPSATSSQALRAELDMYPASAGQPAGGSAIHSAAELGANATGVSGLFSGLSASVITSAASRSLQGTYAALVLQTEFKTGNTMPALSTAFIYAADAGAVKAPAFIHWGQAGASSTAFENKTAGSNAAMTMVVNVNGTLWYVAMSDSRS